MQFKKPKFWDKNRQTIFSLILFPLSIIVYFVAKLKRLKKGKKFKFPIICIGNVYLGGTGKTPISIEIFKILSSINKKPVFIKKFYPYIHDEINILNKIGPVISEKSRIKSLKSLDNSSYEVALLDDGFQDTKFLKDLSIVCFNENNWIGNGNIIPSGPLRESLDALKYADCIMIKGKKDQKKEREKVCPLNLLLNSWMLKKVKVALLRKKKTQLKWQRLIGLSHIIDGRLVIWTI